MTDVDERRLQILDLLSRGGQDLEAQRLCGVCAEVTGASGAAILLVAGEASRGLLCTTDRVSARLEQLQYDLDEGPCIDAYRLDAPVMEPDLAHPGSDRWSSYGEQALRAGARAVFGFPLRLDAVRLGAMTLYNTVPGPLTDDQYANAIVMAEVVSLNVLRLQSRAAPGEIAEELVAGTDLHSAVHQASGMVAAQLDVAVDVALTRLRAHAIREGRSLTAVATDVLAHALRFGPGGTTTDGPSPSAQ